MTPDEAAAVVDDLGNAFAAGDVDAVIERFADEGEVTYAGSELGEVAVGLPALRLLLADLFSRDEHYSWRCDSVHITACVAGCAVLADATLFVDAWPSQPNGPGRESFPYRVSGLSRGSKRGPRRTPHRWRLARFTPARSAVQSRKFSTGCDGAVSQAIVLLGITSRRKPDSGRGAE